MKTILIIVVGIAVGVAVLHGCSKEDREEVISRVGKASRALSGEARPDDQEHDVPNVVRAQQRKERIRQNTKWTAENQALHPVEYCQAQLEVLESHAKELEVVLHKMMVAKSEATRDIADAEATQKSLAKFLVDAKKAYKESATAGKATVALGGFNITLAKAKEKMVEANRKLPYLEKRIGTRKNMVNELDKRIATISAEQKKIVETRERIQNTISDLQLKNVIDGEQGIRDALNAINDSMASLGVDYDDPALTEIVQPSKSANVDAEFEKLMAE